MSHQTPLPPAPRWWQPWKLRTENARLRRELALSRLHVRTLQEALRTPVSEPAASPAPEPERDRIRGWA